MTTNTATLIRTTRVVWIEDGETVSERAHREHVVRNSHGYGRDVRFDRIMIAAMTVVVAAVAAFMIMWIYSATTADSQGEAFHPQPAVTAQHNDANPAGYPVCDWVNAPEVCTSNG